MLYDAFPALRALPLRPSARALPGLQISRDTASSLLVLRASKFHTTFWRFDIVLDQGGVLTYAAYSPGWSSAVCIAAQESHPRCSIWLQRRYPMALKLNHVH